jgi:predicted amidophosphoribosyltransferase
VAGRTLHQIDSTGEIAGVHEAYHVAFYHASRAGYQERISRYIQDFGQGREPQTTRWIKLAVPLITGSTSFDLIIRTLLASEEETTEFTPLDRLCEAIARGSRAVYAPERLEKTRSAPETEQIGQNGERGEKSSGVYRFDAEGLPGGVRVLVVDTLIKSGSTVEAIAEAVHKERPEAEVVCLVLGKADPQAKNTHLNPEYFISPDNGISPVSSGDIHNADTVRLQIPGGRMKNRKRADTNPALSQYTQKGKRSSRFWAYITGSAVIFLTLGALVPILSGRKSVALPEVPVVSASLWAEENASPRAPEPAKAPAAKAKKYWGPPGVIGVPQIGMRRGHSLNAKSVARGTVRQGERVSILKRYKPKAGPKWVKIRTRKGKVGWVFASVVQEKGRR